MCFSWCTASGHSDVERETWGSARRRYHDSWVSCDLKWNYCHQRQCQLKTSLIECEGLAENADHNTVNVKGHSLSSQAAELLGAFNRYPNVFESFKEACSFGGALGNNFMPYLVIMTAHGNETKMCQWRLITALLSRIVWVCAVQKQRWLWSGWMHSLLYLIHDHNEVQETSWARKKIFQLVKTVFLYVPASLEEHLTTLPWTNSILSRPIRFKWGTWTEDFWALLQQDLQCRLKWFKNRFHLILASRSLAFHTGLQYHRASFSSWNATWSKSCSFLLIMVESMS